MSMMSKKVNVILLVLCIVLCIGTIGSHYMIEHPDTHESLTWLESFYFTIITITTIGYGYYHPVTSMGYVLTIFLALSGIGVLFYFFRLIIDEAFSKEFKEKRMKSAALREMEGIKDHIIVCGAGRVGIEILKELERENKRFVAIDKNSEVVNKLVSEKMLAIENDATTDEGLIAAGIERAGTIIAALDNDSDNVYIIISAVQLNPKIKIIGRSCDEKSVEKMKRAGADEVIVPLKEGGKSIVRAVTEPEVGDVLRDMVAEAEIFEFVIEKGSRFVGNTLGKIKPMKKTGTRIIGVKRNGEIIINPELDFIFNEGDIIVAIGHEKQRERLKEFINGRE